MAWSGVFAAFAEFTGPACPSRRRSPPPRICAATEKGNAAVGENCATETFTSSYTFGFEFGPGRMTVTRPLAIFTCSTESSKRSPPVEDVEGGFVPALLPMLEKFHCPDGN